MNKMPSREVVIQETPDFKRLSTDDKVDLIKDHLSGGNGLNSRSMSPLKHHNSRVFTDIYKNDEDYKKIISPNEYLDKSQKGTGPMMDYNLSVSSSDAILDGMIHKQFSRDNLMHKIEKIESSTLIS